MERVGNAKSIGCGVTLGAVDVDVAHGGELDVVQGLERAGIGERPAARPNGSDPDLVTWRHSAAAAEYVCGNDVWCGEPRHADDGGGFQEVAPALAIVHEFLR